MKTPLTRLLILSPMMALLGCHDFVGELGRIGFVSNLQMHALSPWSPEQPIAAGSFVKIMAQQRMNSDSTEPPVVQGAASGDLVQMAAEEDRVVEFTGGSGDRGTVRFWGELDDQVHVRFAPAETALVSHIWDSNLDTALQDELTVVPGETVILKVSLFSAQDEALGWPEDSLQVTGERGVSAWMDGAAVNIVADGEGALHLSVPGVGQWTIPVYTAHIDELVALTFSPTFLGATLQASGWLADGTRLFGVPVSWPGQEEHLDMLLEPTGPVDEACVGDRCWVVGWAPAVSP